MNIYLKLFISFAKVGVMTFGGGYAMLPLLQKEISEKNNWATEEELLDYYAIGQCTPGIIAINTATFVGRKMGGILGGVFASLGMVFPSLIIITIIAMFFKEFSHIEMISNGLAGVRICVVALIFHAVIKLSSKSVNNLETFIIFLLIVLSSFFLGISPVFSVLAGGLAGLIIKKMKKGEQA